MRARSRMLLLVFAIVGLSCTGDDPAPTDVSSEPTDQPSSSASPELSPLVGRRVEIVVSEQGSEMGIEEAIRSSPFSATAELFDEALVESGALSRLA